ncbi:MAG: carboxypeptidase regulatory-like domain-containing protein [Nitrospirae bacterium]|nr:carboxypeptidase regulatory-like domain-containing protein [Nitrospirota bacterium]
MSGTGRVRGFSYCAGITGIVLVSILLLPAKDSRGSGRSAAIAEGIRGYVKEGDGSPVVNAGVGIFDGFTLKSVKTDSDGRYKIAELPVSANHYAILFFTKEGYIPQAANLKIREKTDMEYSTILKRGDMGHNGFVIGSIYKPIRGGKIQFQSGIYSFGKGIPVTLERDHKVIKDETDQDGHFLFEAPAGRYTLSGEGLRERAEIEVFTGQTVIRNLRSGVVLVD